MRTHTTFTDIRRIMKLHTDGVSPEQISEQIYIDVGEIKRVIDVKCAPVKKAKRGE